ncbi:hypothetical protein D8B26_008040 [Coccidioides posadasii str. Silveira]|uniref:Uncharacterized protein n=3 Tax=Coccidioides posadasii TaxID=199306 RepID=E9DE57_COCPS|nr:hypothetical protein CPC735_069990 [Coccidioides posadasii C735 delta SOWgp]EER29317.1 hypothetical protein CPC735_069990 [Coccidioides posadasii C735 delta SOWgp]EFW15411.1 conserved hypothetical protein [Coccidioides posadasii str. Silveira]KMM70374.1 hypothetical protein CPAG_06686 [Coccidioides posadasii RMSCC 3488]QVM13431.1 hypothetical protein D8B26_008040 [Coccidioides posadasii str. Silveira]|eukprot:XP_003071462.1 hypothetical protein CPC735_069990 [Coccidioides posadasii C735 delta SOWgp]
MDIPSSSAPVQAQLPRVTIKYCTQCRWMLRAAYFAQELLSTFSTSLGEVALIPSTGGIFTVTLFHTSNAGSTTVETVLWDRKTQGGFPETKQLKSLVRNIIDPSRNLGHIDRALAKAQNQQDEENTEGRGSGSSSTARATAVAAATARSDPDPPEATPEKKACEDCQ